MKVPPAIRPAMPPTTVPTTKAMAVSVIGFSFRCAGRGGAAQGVVGFDQVMPGIGGAEVLRFLRQQTDFAGMKVMVVSGQSRDEINQALASGADAGLQKPFDNDELVRQVRRLLGDD